MNNGDILYRIINHDDVWICSIIILEEGIGIKRSYRYDKEYQSIYRWFSLCIFSDIKYMVIKGVRLLCDFTTDITNKYLDNDFILPYFKRNNYS